MISLSPNLFFCLGVTFLVAALIIFYFRQRMATVDHKLNAMFQLVQAMAAQSHTPDPMSMPQGNMVCTPTKCEVPTMHTGNLVSTRNDDLISVSDDSSDSESDSDDETTQNQYLQGIKLGSELTEEDAKLEVVENFDKQNSIKIVEMSQDANDESQILEEKSAADDDIESESVSTQDTSYSGDGDEVVEYEEVEVIETVSNTELQDLSDLKEINDDFTLGASSKTIEILDYAKLNVRTLRDLVQEKGLASNTKKMKKPDLLKLLQPE